MICALINALAHSRISIPKALSLAPPRDTRLPRQDLHRVSQCPMSVYITQRVFTVDGLHNRDERKCHLVMENRGRMHPHHHSARNERRYTPHPHKRLRGMTNAVFRKLAKNSCSWALLGVQTAYLLSIAQLDHPRMHSNSKHSTSSVLVPAHQTIPTHSATYYRV